MVFLQHDIPATQQPPKHAQKRTGRRQIKQHMTDKHTIICRIQSVSQSVKFRRLVGATTSDMPVIRAIKPPMVPKMSIHPSVLRH